MSQRRRGREYRSFDRQGEARAVAYLMLAAVPLVFATGVVLPAHVPLGEGLAVSVTCLLLTVTGMICLRAPRRIPAWFWLAIPFVATSVIAGLNLVTSDASTGSQIFFLWPTLYAAMYLSRRALYAVLIAVTSGEAATVFGVFTDAGSAWADLVGMGLALSMSSIVVMTLRERANRLMQVLADQALADPLTGLPNRRSLDIETAKAETRLRRNGGSLAVLSVDLDRFKDINDTWGHATGDLALQAVASALRTVARETDVVARLGGDEFVMLVRGGRQEAHQVADALRQTAAADTSLPCGPPGLSIGIAVLPGDADTIEGLLAASDAALYRAKVAGRGRVMAATDPGAATPGTADPGTATLGPATPGPATPGPATPGTAGRGHNDRVPTPGTT